MENFIRNIKKHKIAALICLAVLTLSVLIAVIMLFISRRSAGQTIEKSKGGASGEGYFTDTDYPVYFDQQGQKLNVRLDGSKTPELKWEITASPVDIITVSREKEESDGRLELVIMPVATGYTTLTFSRTGELGSFQYDAVKIRADITVYTDENNLLFTKITDMKQTAGASGALDSGTPYILSGNRVIMPNGGDWTLTVTAEGEVPQGLYSILPGTDDSGHSYYDVVMDTSLLIDENGNLDQNALTSKLLLKSESLGIEQKLYCIVNEEKELTLAEDKGESEGAKKQ